MLFVMLVHEIETNILFVFGATAPQWPRAPSFKRFLDHTQRRPTVGRTPGRVISSSQRPLPDNTHHSQQQTPLPSMGFEPTIAADDRPQTFALDRVATGTGSILLGKRNICEI
jgi:hypothetical protein